VQQRILWLLTVCSTSTKSSLQVYYDLTHRQICVESFVLKQNGAGLDTKVRRLSLLELGYRAIAGKGCESCGQARFP
jgi:hypothetical protein